GVVSPIGMLLLELHLEHRPRGIEYLLVSGAAWQPQPRAILLLVGRAKGDHREKLLARPAGISHRQISRRHHLVIRIPAQPLGWIIAEPHQLPEPRQDPCLIRRAAGGKLAVLRVDEFLVVREGERVGLADLLPHEQHWRWLTW